MPAASTMYSPANTIFRPQQFANAYRQIGTETGIAGATPHKLVAMLFDGFMETLAEAKGAMRAGRIERKCNAISKAVRIVDEGLRGCLNLKSGGKLAQDLFDLYGYLVMRLTLCNVRNDEAGLDECQRLMQPLREAWMSIAPQAESGTLR